MNRNLINLRIGFSVEIYVCNIFRSTVYITSTLKINISPLLHKLLFLWCRHQESNSGPSDYKTYLQIPVTYKSITYNACQA